MQEVSENLASVAPLEGGTKVHMTTVTPHQTLRWAKRTCNDSKSRFITTPLQTESLVVVMTSKCVFMAIERTQGAKSTLRILLARLVIHAFCTSVPLWMSMTSFPKNPVVLHNQACISWGRAPLEFIGQTEHIERLESTTRDNALHYQEVQDLWRQTQGHMKMQMKRSSRRRTARNKRPRLTPGSKHIAISF